MARTKKVPPRPYCRRRVHNSTKLWTCTSTKRHWMEHILGDFTPAEYMEEVRNIPEALEELCLYLDTRLGKSFFLTSAEITIMKPGAGFRQEGDCMVELTPQQMIEDIRRAAYSQGVHVVV